MTLERLFVLKTLGTELEQHPDLPVRVREVELGTIASKFHFPTLVSRVNDLFPGPLDCTEHMISFNSARNCLSHTRGIVTERHCNTPGKDKLVVKGRRSKLFFKRGDLEVPAEVGKPGPEYVRKISTSNLQSVRRFNCHSSSSSISCTHACSC